MKRVMHINRDEVLIGVVGKQGGVHFHARHNNQRSCGIEFHKRAGSGSDNCWLLDGPCEHDGSTLVAREKWLPLFQECNKSGDFEPLFAALEVECLERLHPPHTTAARRAGQ